MENYVSGDFKKIHPTDDETLKITRKDNIQVKLPSEIVWKLKDVRFIPSLKKKISVSQLDQEGHCTTFTRNEWKITKGVMVIAHGKKSGTLYVTSNMENIVAVAKSDEE